MSERLYYNDSYLFEFEAKVESVVKEDSIYKIILDRSAFYPESGGQNHDTGTLDNKTVIAVFPGDDDQVVHHCEKWEADKGQRIVGKIDIKRRFANMRKHTGQHILSQAFLRVASAETVGAHLGETESTIELASLNISSDNLRDAEFMTNDIIMRNLPVKIFYSEYEKLADLGVRRIPERRGQFRLIGIGDFELTACGGTHCGFTGEIGSLKIIGSEKIRNHTRITFLCGHDAASDYYLKNEVVEKLTCRFTCHFSSLENSVIKLHEHNENLRKEISRLQKELLPYQIKELKDGAVEISGIRIISKVYSDYDFRSLKDLALSISKAVKSIVLFYIDDKLIISVSDGIDKDASFLSRLFIDNFGGRGGGNPVIAQVGRIADENIDSMMAEFTELIRRKINRE
ncbi:MAG TPA: hypothetical protein ENL22_05835 [candidate division Zixibacteria bacterium]|nr:hypothetical protein [candidate division Zixibacteria bacterium]